MSLRFRKLSDNDNAQALAVAIAALGAVALLPAQSALALARLDRDVLTRPGVKWVILLEGINDINIRTRPNGANPLTAEELIGGYRQIIERCHAQGIR